MFKKSKRILNDTKFSPQRESIRVHINLHGLLPVTCKVYSKSLIIQVKPYLKVTYQLLVIDEWAHWRRDSYGCILRLHGRKTGWPVILGVKFEEY